MKLIKATIEIVIATPDDAPGYAEDAMAETVRPLLQEFGGGCFVDWRWVGIATLPQMPDWSEYQPKEIEK